MSDPTLPRTPQADAAFGPSDMRLAIEAARATGRQEERQRMREHILNRSRQLDPFADKATITELRILAGELGWTGGTDA